MVTVKELQARYKTLTTPDLLNARDIAYKTLERRGLAAEDLALVFMALGVLNDELQLRAVGERPKNERGEWVDRDAGKNDLT